MTPGPATPSAAKSPGRAGRVLAAVFAAIAVLAVAGVAFVSSGARPPAERPGGATAAANGAAGNTNVGSADDAAVAATAVKPPPGMAKVALTALPKEARAVVAEIARGGPFRYRQDGVTFFNREGRLPGEPRDYYREYTVDTPGLGDRGPRRIVVGRGGELYYTPDHYVTFQWIVRNGGAP